MTEIERLSSQLDQLTKSINDLVIGQGIYQERQRRHDSEIDELTGKVATITSTVGGLKGDRRFVIGFITGVCALWTLCGWYILKTFSEREENYTSSLTKISKQLDDRYRDAIFEAQRVGSDLSAFKSDIAIACKKVDK